MSHRIFFVRLSVFIAPFAVVFALPFVLLARSYEIAPVSVVAARHARAAPLAVYGPAYSNPDKGYKFASMAQRQPPVVAIGTSRVMQFRSDLFIGGEDTFYNGGGVVTRLFDHRLLFERLSAFRTRRALVGLDPWAFNERWAEFSPDPSVAREYDGDYSSLDVIQRSLQAYSDLWERKFSLSQIFGARNAFGINGMSRGNGFLRDGSYFYADVLRNPKESPDYGFRDTLERIRTGKARFEFGDRPSERALAELDALAELWQRSGFRVVAFMPPFAPAVVDAMRASGRHDYVFRTGEAVRSILERHQVPFVDFTSCGPVPCRDEDFVDGFHGGSALYAAILLELATRATWLEEVTDRPSIETRLARHSNSWELARP